MYLIEMKYGLRTFADGSIEIKKAESIEHSGEDVLPGLVMTVDF